MKIDKKENEFCGRDLNLDKLSSVSSVSIFFLRGIVFIYRFIHQIVYCVRRKLFLFSIRQPMQPSVSEGSRGFTTRVFIIVGLKIFHLPGMRNLCYIWLHSSAITRKYSVLTKLQMLCSNKIPYWAWSGSAFLQAMQRFYVENQLIGKWKGFKLLGQWDLKISPPPLSS